MTAQGNLPSVSIVTPSLNQARFIRDSIESVLSQNYPRLEYIVMDGGSTDETLDILRGYGDRLTWRSVPDFGQANALNSGFRLASGEILGWLNSDDTYRPGAVKAAVQHLVANPDTAVVYGEAYYIDQHNMVIGIYPTEDFSMDRLAQACVICQPSSFVRRAVLEAVGMLDPTLHYCMDYDLWIRIGRHFRIERIKPFLANSRRHRRTKSFSHRDQLFQEIFGVAEKSFGHVSPHWRVCRAYYRLADLAWPFARWVLWPTRQVLPQGVHRWLRKTLPLLIHRQSANWTGPGGRS